MSPWTTVPIIHCTDYTHTATTYQTHYISLGLPLSDRRVLSVFITLLVIATLRSHSMFPEFSLVCPVFTCVTRVLILAWFTSSCLISACPVAYSLSWIYALPCCFGLCLRLAWTLFCLWITRLPSITHAWFSITLVVSSVPYFLLMFDPACILTMSVNKAMRMNP